MQKRRTTTNGDHGKRGTSRRRLGRAEERALLERWQKHGDQDARDELVEVLMPRVESIAWKYRSNYVPREDLVAEGLVGLLVGIDRFDPDRKVRLMTYASHWIRAYIVNAVLKGWARGKTGTGVSRSKVFFKIRRQRARYGTMYHQEGPLVERLSRDLEVSEARVRDMLRIMDSPDASLDAIAEARNPDDPEYPLPDGAPLPDDQVTDLRNHEAFSESISYALTMLDDRERDIVRKRLMCEPQITLAQLGREMGVSRERARQIKQRVKSKLAAIMDDTNPELRSMLAGF
jgi:RNA polymerase sigma-32 factor